MVFIIIGFTFLSSCENKGKDDSSMSSDYQLIWSDEYQDENNSYETKYLLNKSQNAITKILSNGFTESTFYDNMYINVKKEQYG